MVPAKGQVNLRPSDIQLEIPKGFNTIFDRTHDCKLLKL